MLPNCNKVVKLLQPHNSEKISDCFYSTDLKRVKQNLKCYNVDMKKIIFLGTSVFAQAILKDLVNTYEIALVVTQPDRPTGRRQEIQYSAVKETALAYGLPLFQPEVLKEDYQRVLSINADQIISCAYGQYIPEAIIAKGVLNVHASLLPKYRGGAPMHRAIINGDKTTGITLMKSGEKMDAGPIYCQKEIEIRDDDTVTTLQDRLIICAEELLKEKLPAIIVKELPALPQDEAEVSFAGTIKAADELIDFTRSYQAVYDQIRGLLDWPVGYGKVEGRKLKIFAISKLEQETTEDNGTIIGLIEDKLAIAVDHKLLGSKEVQAEGKKRMPAKEFMQGSGQRLIGKRFDEY